MAGLGELKKFSTATYENTYRITFLQAKKMEIWLGANEAYVSRSHSLYIARETRKFSP